MNNTNTTPKRISQLRNSIKLQERTKANLEAMSIADGGRTIELCKQIIAVLTAQLEISAATPRTGVVA